MSFIPIFMHIYLNICIYIFFMCCINISARFSVFIALACKLPTCVGVFFAPQQ